MIKYCIIACLASITLACNKTNKQKPIWINNTKTSYLTTDTFYFKTSKNNCNAILSSFAQPFALAATQKNDTLMVYFKENSSVINGPAHICLQSKDENYYYAFFLESNNSEIFSTNDYRSPKTVNIDSSLSHQSIKLTIDSNRNIVPISSKKLFVEENISFLPKAKNYRAIANQPITAFYVQAGSAENITISAKYNPQLKVVEIITKPIYDKYKNMVANGTNVKFSFINNKQNGESNASTIDGIAKISLPLNPAENWKIVASINQAKSNQIILTN